MIDGHRSLLNSQRIFLGQKANPRHLKISLSSYRSCSSKSDQLGKDYFSYLLIKELLKQNKLSLAKGLVQKMKTPHYKFIGVLELQKAQGEKVDKKYILRLVQFMNKKLNGFGVVQAKREFSMFYLTNAKVSVRKKMSVRNLRKKITARGDGTANISNNKCVPWVQGASFDREISFRKTIFKTSKIPGGVKDIRKFFGDGIDRSVKSAGIPLYQPCLKSGKPFKLATALFTQILFEKGEKEADAFIRYVHSGLRSQADVLGYYMDSVISDHTQILGHSEDDGSMDQIMKKLKDPSNKLAKFHGVASCAKRIEKAIESYAEVKDQPNPPPGRKKWLEGELKSCGVAGGKSSGRATALQLVMHYNIGKEGYYRLLRKLVEFEKVCKSAEILFKNIGRKPKFFPTSINYMVNSPNIDPKEEYSCGDAELETLLGG
jgi:hypothetical protein